MLPHDLPDLLGEDALLHPAVRANGSRGLQASYFVDSPAGRRFVKVTPEGTSPHLAPAVSRILSHLRVPHPETEYAFRSGRHLTHAPVVAGKTLGQLTQKEVREIPHDEAARTLFGEWLASVSDRHNGNYLYHPKHGVQTIDHDMSLSPDTWTYHGQPHRSDFDFHSIVREPYASSVNPGNSSLYTLMREYGGMSPGQEVPKETLARALTHESDIERHIAHATAGLPPASREATLAAYRLRMKHLKAHLAEHKKLTVAHLHELHDAVINEAWKNQQSSRS